MTAPARPGLAEVLAQHETAVNHRTLSRCCSCRDVDYADVPPEVSTWSEHAAHLAAVAAQWFADELACDEMREAVARAQWEFWTEGDPWPGASFAGQYLEAAADGLAAVRATVGGGR